MENYLEAFYIPEYAERRNKIYEIYEALNNLLGDKKYFFGDKPSTLDAVAVGHLCCQYFAELEVNRLREIISKTKKYTNLENYILRNAKDLFNANKEYKIEKRKSAVLRYTTNCAQLAVLFGLGFGVIYYARKLVV